MYFFFFSAYKLVYANGFIPVVNVFLRIHRLILSRQEKKFDCDLSAIWSRTCIASKMQQIICGSNKFVRHLYSIFLLFHLRSIDFTVWHVLNVSFEHKPIITCAELKRNIHVAISKMKTILSNIHKYLLHLCTTPP